MTIAINDKNLGERGRTALNILQKLRVERGLTLRQLEELSGVDKSQISRIETGKNRPHTLTLQKLAEALHAKLEDLMPLRGVENIEGENDNADQVK